MWDDAAMAIPKTGPERDAYEAGYRDGESNGYFDWRMAMSEIVGVPEDEVDVWSPTAVATWIAERMERAGV